MAITSPMAKMTIRSTFALDPETVNALGRLAERWAMSRSEVLRRIVNAAARVEELDGEADALAALEEIQDRLALTEEGAEDWVREIRREREGWGT
jgi:predicted transcriptional regulator